MRRRIKEEEKGAQEEKVTDVEIGNVLYVAVASIFYDGNDNENPNRGKVDFLSQRQRMC